MTVANILVFLSAAFGASIGAILTAVFASRRFKNEARWKRQIDAYDRVFSALYEILETVKYAMDSDTTDPEVRRAIEKRWDRANLDITRLMTVEVYLLSEEAANVVNDYRIDVVMRTQDQEWWETHDRQVMALMKCSAKLVSIARRDVGLPPLGPKKGVVRNLLAKTRRRKANH